MATDERPQNEAPLVVLVGHCGFDAGSLERAVRRASPRARVEHCREQGALEAMTPTARLLLVNRVVEGDFPTESGVELIRMLKATNAGERTNMMLVSNFASAQEEAEMAGALPGFGKSEVGGEEAARQLAQAIG